MPTECCIIGCSNDSSKDKKQDVQRSYYQVPKMKTNRGEDMRKLTEARRREWIAQIRRKGLTFDSAKYYHRVCSDHFVQGKPAYEMYRNDPDWSPSLNLGHTSGKTPSGRGKRLKERTRKRQVSTPENSSANASSAGEDSESDEQLEPISNEETTGAARLRQSTVPFFKRGSMEFEGPRTKTVSTQTDLTSSLLVGMQDELNCMLAENVLLRKDIKECKYNQDYFADSDEKVKFFTGLPNVTTLMLLFEFLQPHLPGGPRSALNRFEVLILTFFKLRFNLPLQLLAYMFRISRTTATSYYQKTLHVMSVEMLPLIIWPERDVLRSNQPNEFRRAFGGRIAVVIDCFEIFIETPSDLVAKAQTFSSYKHHNTAKYLIGITPAGAISYISKGWGGRTSDKHLTEFSDFVGNLNPGDVVLADRGFDISDVVGYVQAEVKIPAFTKGKSQLTAHEIESTRKIAHIRIHIERVIGVLCAKYGILNAVIPLEMLSTRENEKEFTLDKIVIVCCGLVNLCESVVPLK